MAAAPVLSEKPNFWSSTPVATAGCVCASTPGVTRTSTRCRGRASGWASAAILAISPAESSTIRPTP